MRCLALGELHPENGASTARAPWLTFATSVWVFLLLGMEAIRTYRSNPHLEIATYRIPTWTTPLVMALVVAALMPGTSLLGHLCGIGVGYLCKEVSTNAARGQCLTLRAVGLGYLKFLSPPEKALRWIETRFNLLARLPHYVSVDQKTYGRFGVLPTSGHAGGVAAPVALVATTQRVVA